MLYSFRAERGLSGHFLQRTVRPARRLAARVRAAPEAAVRVAEGPRPAGCRHRGAAAPARDADALRQGHGGLRRRVLARQVGADQRDLLRRLQAPHHARQRRPHHDVPDRAGLRRRSAALPAPAADRNAPAAAAADGMAAGAREVDPRRPGRERSRRSWPRPSRRSPRCATSPRTRPARSASGTTTRPKTTRWWAPTAWSRCRAGAMP